MTSPVPAWKPHVPHARKAAALSRETLVFLHLAKSGGSSLITSIRRSLDWNSIFFTAPHAAHGEHCVCGDTECTAESKSFAGIDEAASTASSERGLFVRTGHSKYSQVEWLRTELTNPAGSVRIVTTARPARERVVSMFRDYWDQVALGDQYISGELQPRVLHRKNVGLNYVKDAKHYRDDSGRIDGVAWFTAFESHRGGINFLLDDVFERSPETLEHALTSHLIEVYPIRELDDFVTTLTGRQPQRARVSSEPNPHVARALEDASSIIDEIAAIDAPYDQALAEHLGRERFDPKRSKK